MNIPSKLMKIGPRKQTGLTMISLVLILAVGAFFVMLALRLTPIYLENFKVSSHLQNLASDPGVANMSENDILDRLFKRFSIDDVDNVKPEDVFFELQNNKLLISIDYEVRAPTISNIDIIASFHEQVEVNR
jgi:hypothetical protein